MPCTLKDDPTLAFDFVAKTASSSILFVENNAGTALIESALFNGVNVAPDANNKITITEKAGVNILRFTINGALNGDEVRFKEDCGGGNSELRQKFTFNTDPVRGYQINAT
jgi:hypothetical protein